MRKWVNFVVKGTGLAHASLNMADWISKFRAVDKNVKNAEVKY